MVRQSFFADYEINNPAPADVRSVGAAVAQHLLVGAPGVHQGVGQQG
jgi:hypothetical protein